MLLLLLSLLVGCDGFDLAPVDDDTDNQNVDTFDPNDPCGGITWEGECDGDVAVWCEDDEVFERDCADDGLSCGLTDEYGYWCVQGNTAPTENPSETSTDGMLTTTTYTATSTSNGDLTIPVNITSSNQSFMVTVKSSTDTGLYIWRVRNPSGGVVLSSDNDSHTAITTGLYWQTGDNQINWPSRAADGPLAVGEWKVDLGVTNSSGNQWAARSIDVTVQVKSDSNLSSGQVKVAMVYAGNLGSNSTVVNGVTGAVDRWRQIWQPYGLELFVTYYNATSVPTNLPSLNSGSDHYATVSASERDHKQADIVMFIGDNAGGSGTLGMAGGLPGTTVSTRRAATILSWLEHAGTNGTFNAAEVSMMGETMAHEAGHYMGLFHVVEFGWNEFDPLSDTATCSNESTCTSALSDNLMFPSSVCNQSGCVAQDELSTQQQGVKHRYIGTL